MKWKYEKENEELWNWCFDETYHSQLDHKLLEEVPRQQKKPINEKEERTWTKYLNNTFMTFSQENCCEKATGIKNLKNYTFILLPNCDDNVNCDLWQFVTVDW